MKSKICTKCGKNKKLSEFHKNIRTKDKRLSQCKLCRKGDHRDQHYKRVYGISLEEYNIILIKQSGVCKICGDKAGARNLHIDHCHDTNIVRGLLCANCNTGIGNLRDNIELLEKAIKYLKNEL